MAEEPAPSLPDELRPVMDVEIHMDNLRTDADQPKVQAALTALPGVEAVNFDAHKVSIRYDPEKVTRARLCAAVTEAGFHVAESDGAPSAPPIEPSVEAGSQVREQEQ